jgi:hypothetical protein
VGSRDKYRGLELRILPLIPYSKVALSPEIVPADEWYGRPGQGKAGLPVSRQVPMGQQAPHWETTNKLLTGATARDSQHSYHTHARQPTTCCKTADGRQRARLCGSTSIHRTNTIRPTDKESWSEGSPHESANPPSSHSKATAPCHVACSNGCHVQSAAPGNRRNCGLIWHIIAAQWLSNKTPHGQADCSQ